MAETMNETQGDVYVRRDVFEARMDRMEMLLEKTVLEIKSYVDKSTGETKAYVEKAIGGLRDEVRSEVGSLRTEMQSEIGGLKKETGGLRAEIAEVKNEVKGLSARVQAVENTLSWWIGLFAILIALLAFATPIADSIKKIFKPSFTLDDIKNIVRAEIASQSGGGE